MQRMRSCWGRFITPAFTTAARACSPFSPLACGQSAVAGSIEEVRSGADCKLPPEGPRNLQNLPHVDKSSRLEEALMARPAGGASESSWHGTQ